MFFAAGGATSAVVGCGPLGGPNITEILRFFPNVFEWVLEGHRTAKMVPGAAQEAEKGPQMLTLGCLRADF